MYRSRLRRDCSASSCSTWIYPSPPLFLQRFATIKLKIHIYTMQLRKFIPRDHQPLWSSQDPIHSIVFVECQLYRIINQLTDALNLLFNYREVSQSRQPQSPFYLFRRLHIARSLRLCSFLSVNARNNLTDHVRIRVRMIDQHEWRPRFGIVRQFTKGPH